MKQQTVPPGCATDNIYGAFCHWQSSSLSAQGVLFAVSGAAGDDHRVAEDACGAAAFACASLPHHLSSSPIARGLRGIASVLTGADYAGPLCCALQVPEFSLLVANALLLIGEAAMCSATRRI